MDDLRRELAPVGDLAWEQIESEAKRTLSTWLTARRLVDSKEPRGWRHSALNLGRTVPLEPAPVEGVEARIRRVQPLVELRSPFDLSREEIDAASRGADDVALESLVEATRRIALAEDRLVFRGEATAGIRGMWTDSPHDPIVAPEDFTAYPALVAGAIDVLRREGVAGPYAIALGPRTYEGVARTVEGGYPVMRHVERLVDGSILRAPALEGGLVASRRGGDFELVIGRDLSIGYLDHDSTSVRLYLEESVTFRPWAPEAAVAIRRAS
jgi:uncharacterized linocin/CFP29 family protein